MRDPHARGHAVQVAEYSRVIADAIDPQAELLDRESLQLACEIHDVGIIAVPEGILDKEGRLTPEELRKVRQHPLVGRRILEPLLADATVLDVVRWHHEWWDGNGYPDGLVGEQIPLSARVVALAEAVAAMTRPRAYRGALPWEDTLGEVRALSGKQFDPALVSHLETVIGDLKRLDVEAVQKLDEGAEAAPLH
jgi:HD-GYP domain-containing protein (c-di-GMP phosphodiesterase class II)